MMRDIVRIDRDKCNGCGRCAEACSEGAIEMVDGKAMLVRETHCDGLGACLPVCPVDAISIEKRESSPFILNESKDVPSIPVNTVPMGSCPGSGVRVMSPAVSDDAPIDERSYLGHWPIQLRLVPVTAPFFRNCDLLVAADCTAFSCNEFQRRFMQGRSVIIGCPKLDPADSWEKLKSIISMNDIRSVTVTRMDVPCCSSIVNAVIGAVRESGKDIPVEVFTLFPNGKVQKS